ncbi:DUF5004 domain-containing protein [Flavobacterium terrisoli]|uniref:DUF5004 domain-containing protein n=1 Tax=Flavobacterium terrisoli TaxID=3242195 RepID=UPI002543DF94|nr:DUF5004 domain-containing protein [Flavobacterium buctense]
MKKLLLLHIFLFAFAATQSQTIDETLITGKWKVKKATALKDADKPETKELVAGFQKAIYTFNEDHSFAFETKSSAKMMEQLEKLFQNKKWIFDKKKKQIKVGLKNEGYTTIIFLVRTEEKKIIFTIEDAQIELVMKKQ